jgi:hypothetical protein
MSSADTDTNTADAMRREYMRTLLNLVVAGKMTNEQSREQLAEYDRPAPNSRSVSNVPPRAPSPRRAQTHSTLRSVARFVPDASDTTMSVSDVAAAVADTLEHVGPAELMDVTHVPEILRRMQERTSSEMQEGRVQSQLENELRIAGDLSARFRVTVTHPSVRGEKLTGFQPPLSYLVFVPLVLDISALHREAVSRLHATLVFPKFQCHRSVLQGVTISNTTLHYEDRQASRQVTNPKGGRRVRQWQAVAVGDDVVIEDVKSFGKRTDEVALCIELWNPHMTYRPRRRAPSPANATTSDDTDIADLSEQKDISTEAVADVEMSTAAERKEEDVKTATSQRRSHRNLSKRTTPSTDSVNTATSTPSQSNPNKKRHK